MSDDALIRNYEDVTVYPLDDEEQTFIAREAVIKKKDGNFLGVEFLGRTWDDDPLAAYLKKKLR